MLQKAYNFAAGPAMLPNEVLLQIQSEMFNWQHTGISILEIGHRTKEIQQLLENIKIKLTTLLAIPDNYKILFTHGGGQGQFAAVPMNLSHSQNSVNYIITGLWSKRASEIATQYTNVNSCSLIDDVINSNNCKDNDQINISEKINNFITKNNSTNLSPTSYLFFCPNETVDGIYIDLTKLLSHDKLATVADMTSLLMMETLDIKNYDLIFVATQKNLGIAGLTIVIIKEELLNQLTPQIITPNIWHYQSLNKHNSSNNTIPVFAIYVMDLMLNWISNQGGVTQLMHKNKTNAQKIYNLIDNSNGFYINNINIHYRSSINIVFDLYDKLLIDKFLLLAKNSNLINLRGHAVRGGLRVNLYNVMPSDGVDALLDCMRNFIQNH